MKSGKRTGTFVVSLHDFEKFKAVLKKSFKKQDKKFIMTTES